MGTIKLFQGVPGISDVESKTTEEGRVLLKFQDGVFEDPFLARYISDGTIKMLAYLTLLYDPNPHPLLCVEEPENQLYPKLLWELAKEFRAYAKNSFSVSDLNLLFHAVAFAFYNDGVCGAGWNYPSVGRPLPAQDFADIPDAASFCSPPLRPGSGSARQFKETELFFHLFFSIHHKNPSDCICLCPETVHDAPHMAEDFGDDVRRMLGKSFHDTDEPDRAIG